MLLAAQVATAQIAADTTAPRRGPYNLVVIVGGGLSYYSRLIGIPPGVQNVAINRITAPATVRLMWYPDHRLRIGLESGRVPLYSYQVTASGERARVGVSAIPILLLFSMPLAWLSEVSPDGKERSLAQRLSVTAGPGAYIVRSDLSYLGEVNTSKVSIGWMLAGAYSQPISQRVRLAAEVKWYNITAPSDAVLSIQALLVWRAFSW
ncbi:hypothetical protein [Spirosoma montaniterrae]|uniref:hypothetical protein n=1 Tax=Spirosoma montaniterrae TaxID=1178516 RepID=UPI001E353ADD|nr:hypothetical protein [Spirosoma montaniterrae]